MHVRQASLILRQLHRLRRTNSSSNSLLYATPPPSSFRSSPATGPPNETDVLLTPLSHSDDCYIAPKMIRTWKSEIKQVISMIVSSPLHVLLFIIPFAIWSYLDQWSPKYIFCLNFIVMLPLANILGDATEVLSMHTGETIGGLVNATMGNAVEVISK